MIWALIKYAALWEGGWWVARRNRRASVFEIAQKRAAELGRPLIVIGAPDSWTTGGYGCGDVTIDLEPQSSCPHHIQADITRPLPLSDDSAVIFVSCTLEYVDDYESAVAELMRISGGELYVVRVEPWTLTAYLYPGAQRTIGAPRNDGRFPAHELSTRGL